MKITSQMLYESAEKASGFHQRIASLDDVIRFGKYKGRTFRWLLDCAASTRPEDKTYKNYLGWALRERVIVTLSVPIMEKIAEALKKETVTEWGYDYSCDDSGCDEYRDMFIDPEFYKW